MIAPQQQINLPMMSLEGFTFNVSSLIAIDATGYTHGIEGRKVVLHLVGPHAHVFSDTRADAAYLWYLNLIGQARIQPAHVT